MGNIEGRSNKNFPRLPPTENILCTALVQGSQLDGQIYRFWPFCKTLGRQEMCALINALIDVNSGLCVCAGTFINR